PTPGRDRRSLHARQRLFHQRLQPPLRRPRAAPDLAGLRKQGADAHRRQLLARRARCRDERRHDRRALRDRRQQRRHGRRRAVLACGGPTRTGDTARRTRLNPSAACWPRSGCTVQAVELYEAMRCAPTSRRFTSDPVPSQALERALEAARFAPSGGNRQGWRVVMVREPDTRRALRDLYLLHWRAYMELTGAAELLAKPEQADAGRL